MIELGLARIRRLLHNTPQPWRAIHVAGTNGKGSICAYLAALFHASGQSCGRFTSPHLIDRWDGIAVDGAPVSEAAFREAEAAVKQREKAGGIGASEFELLTATAFELFNRAQVRFAVVEAGMGGRLDATNAMHHKDVAVIARIGLDHQAFLGNTLEEIATQKAGIISPGVKVVVHPTNPPSVLEALEQHAREFQAADFCVPGIVDLAAVMAEEGWEPHQVENLAVAQLAFRCAFFGSSQPLTHLLPALRRVEWPGRLQKLDISAVAGRTEPVLLDGAHNTQSAEALAAYVTKHLRVEGQPLTWVLAATQGKDMNGILALLLRPGDRVAAVRFEPVDGMPWVSPVEPADLLSMTSQHGISPLDQHDSGSDVKGALTWASSVAAEGPLVIAGSLYLVSSVLRLLRKQNS